MTDYRSPTVVWPSIPLNGITPLELAVLTDARIGKMWWRVLSPVLTINPAEEAFPFYPRALTIFDQTSRFAAHRLNGSSQRKRTSYCWQSSQEQRASMGRLVGLTLNCTSSLSSVRILGDRQSFCRATPIYG